MSKHGTDVAAYKTHFSDFVGMGENGFLVRGSLQESVIFLVIVFVINFVFIYRGLSKGIEEFCKYAMPLLIVFALIVLVRVLTLGTPDPAQPEANVNNALGFMWNPKTGDKSVWVALANPELWLNAAGQIFFTLSVGFGIVLNYASYLQGRRRRGPLGPDRQLDQRVLRGLPGRPDHRAGGVPVPGPGQPDQGHAGLDVQPGVHGPAGGFRPDARRAASSGRSGSSCCSSPRSPVR